MHPAKTRKPRSATNQSLMNHFKCDEISSDDTWVEGTLRT
jgi:hypothetical protein